MSSPAEMLSELGGGGGRAGHSLLPLPPPRAVFTVPVSGLFGGGTEYAAMAADAVRMMCIQVTIQLMVYLSSEDPLVGFFTSDFLLLLLYILLGVMLYWLALRKLVTFT
jgi:hypothetical protein